MKSDVPVFDATVRAKLSKRRGETAVMEKTGRREGREKEEKERKRRMRRRLSIGAGEPSNASTSRA